MLPLARRYPIAYTDLTSRCQTHLVSVIIIALVAALNVKGWYIGEDYPGNSGTTAQQLDVLGLLVFAKLLVNPPTQH
jgi:hypothetical protein